MSQFVKTKKVSRLNLGEKYKRMIIPNEIMKELELNPNYNWYISWSVNKIEKKLQLELFAV